MTDNPNLGYYQSSQGSLTGFDAANIPTNNPNIAVTGWSIEELRRFLLNQSDINFPSNEWILRVEQMIRDHENDFNNPHQTTLDQIVGDFVRQILGNITPGTIPDVSPFYSFDAITSLPLGTIFPATFTTNNLYRQTAGGWLVDPATESEIIGTDYISNRPGLPLFSGMTNITPVAWATTAGVTHNTTLSDMDDLTVSYPFTFKEVQETPVIGQFGVDIPMTQDLQVAYTTSFFVIPSALGGKIRIFQPNDPSNYIEVNLEDGNAAYFSDVMAGSTVRYVNGAIRVSVSFTSLVPTPDNKLRLIHINDGQSGDGTRQGSLGRHLFSIGQPQTTRAALNQPVMKNLATASSTSTFVPNFSKVSAPASLDNVIITMGLNLYPSLPLAPVIDPTIMSFGPLVISRDQKTIRVSVSGNPVFTSDILEGLNVITLSYSPTKLIFKDLANDRQSITGVYPVLPTTNVSFGPFGGYLHYVHFYAQADNNAVVEYLNNG